MVKGYGHIALTCADVKASIDFYCEKLGFKQAFTLKDADGNPWIEYIGIAPGQFLELFYAKPGFANNPGSYSHVCLVVEDINTAASTLKAKGVAITSGPSQGRDGNWQCWVQDPDGNRIEFMQISPDSSQGTFVF